MGKKYYDKLLHILGAFTALIWLTRFWAPVIALIIVFLLCVAKTLLNFIQERAYRPYGDWIANVAGFSLWLAYHQIGG